MNFLELLWLLISLSVFGASGFPQSPNEVAAGTKLIEQSYYHSGVKIIVKYVTSVGLIPKFIIGSRIDSF